MHPSTQNTPVETCHPPFNFNFITGLDDLSMKLNGSDGCITPQKTRSWGHRKPLPKSLIPKVLPKTALLPYKVANREGVPMLVRQSVNTRSVPPERNIVSAASGVSEPFLRKTLSTLSIPRHFFAEARNNTLIGNWIADQFRSYGYRVVRQGPYRNVVAVPTAPSGPVTLIGAHYDSVPGTPGADDNASGVTALLALAKITSEVETDASVCFVAFNSEEDGLVGSCNFVEKGISALNLDIKEAHVLEMIGYTRTEPDSQARPGGLPIRIPKVGDFLGLAGNKDSSRVLARLLRCARSYIPELPVVGLRVYFGLEKYVPSLWRSDHAPFWKARIPAVLWTDTAEFRNPNYHLSSDLPETIDYEFLRRVTQLLLAYILSGSSSEVRDERTT